MSTAFWSVLLVGSCVALSAGFLGGQNFAPAANAGALPQPQLSLLPPAHRAIAAKRRLLFGLHSLDGGDEPDRYADPDLAVVSHRDAGGYNARRDRARIAVIVLDASHAGASLDPFLASPLPFALAIAPHDDDAATTLADARANAKVPLVDVTGARTADIHRELEAGAAGIVGTVPRTQADALASWLHHDTLVIEAGLDDDASLYAVAKHRAHALERDVIADARDDAPYIDFMLRNALTIAQRHGSVIVAIHARPESFVAFQRFAARAERDGADVVAITEL